MLKCCTWIYLLSNLLCSRNMAKWQSEHKTEEDIKMLVQFHFEDCIWQKDYGLWYSTTSFFSTHAYTSSNDFLLTSLFFYKRLLQQNYLWNFMKWLYSRSSTKKEQMRVTLLTKTFTQTFGLARFPNKSY